MAPLANLALCLLGGLRFSKGILANILRGVLFSVFLSFSMVFLYSDFGLPAILVGSGVIASIVLIIELLMWILEVLLDSVVEISESVEDIDSLRPENIPAGIWALRSVISSAKHGSLDNVVSDLVASGIDPASLIDLIDYVLNPANSRTMQRVEGSKSNHVNIVRLCGKMISLPFDRKQLRKFFTANHTIWYVLIATALCFAGCCLFLDLHSQYSGCEKWWLGFILTTALYSIIHRPAKDPFMSTVDDCWTGCGRIMGITVICAIWKIILELEKIKTTTLPFYNWEIDWRILRPHVVDFCHWALLLFPIWLLVGFIGHPVGVFNGMVEAFCRYSFGQSGVIGIRHMAIQLLRGIISSLFAWILLRGGVTSTKLGGAIGLAALCGSIPVSYPSSDSKRLLISFVWPLCAAILYFVIPFVCMQSKVTAYDTKLTITCLAWCVAAEYICPFLCSYNRFFIVHLRVIPRIPFIGICHSISSMIFAPLFLTMCLWNSELPSWILALIIVHGTQKALTEGHVFALAIVLCSSLLRSDFGLEKSDCNLAISLLIATKAEVFIPMLKFLYRSRCIYMIDPDLFDRRLIQILGMQLMQWVVGWLPGPDMYLKVPCLVWSAISGSSVLLAGGSPYLILPGAIRPFCFFDWPMKERGGVRTMFTRNISDYPVETPVYTSASMALAKKFGRIVRKGKIGSVTCGDMFLFRCGALSIVLSVVAIEPVSYHIQLRGLEYNSRMGCHEDESFFLDELVESASAASLAACSVLSSYELRQKYVPLKLYSVTKTPVSDAFLGVNGDVIKQWFLFAYCRSIAKGGVVAAQIQAVDANYRDSAEVERLMRVIFSLMDYQTDNIPVYVGFWSVFDGILFEDQVLKTNELTEMFKGLIHVPDEFSWVYSAGSTLNDLVISTVRMGAALSFLASSGVAPSMELETDEVTFLRQALDFTMECEQDCVIAPLDAEEFEREFFRGKKVGLIGMEVVMGMPCVLRFVKYEEEWSVFQLCPAFVHALWGSQARAILFWGNQESERLAISGNVEFLNNMILQSCDSPIGYPAYTSGFLDSLVDPLVL